jgi:MFS family permease
MARDPWRQPDANRVRLSSDSLLRDPVFRTVLLSGILARFASAAMAVLLGFQVFAITGQPLDLGLLGLVEAIPGVGLVLYGGHIADRLRRRSILLVTSAGFTLLAAGIACLSFWQPHEVGPLFAVAFLLGMIRAFEDPAAVGLEAQVVPLHALVRGTAMLATTARLAGVLGGFLWSWAGPTGTYAAISLLFAASLVALLPVPDDSQPPVQTDERGLMTLIGEGVRTVLRDQLLLGSMMLDLFAVFFGGANALLPAIATEVLHTGPVGFGLLRSASAAGSMLAALSAARLLPEQRAGAALLWVIGGFGVAIVVFGLSQWFWLSLIALFVAGVCDGLSVVIRRAILRLASPEGMRGRIAAVKSVFVGSSNELGAFESGLVASWLGLTAAVWSGGLMTIGIVGITALLAPKLRQLDLVAMGALQSTKLPPSLGKTNTEVITRA